MKTVGIMTFHFADNYGAVLQSYALQKTINSFPECQAEIINYIPAVYKYPKYSINIYKKQTFKGKRELFNEFLKKECGIRKDTCSYISGNQYDYYCAGSDQIWNTDPMYEEYFFPHIDREAKKISYAASLGYGANSFRLNKKMLKQYLPGFKAVSVRESEYVGFIHDLTGQPCKRVLDPTLLLNKRAYDEIMPKNDLRKGDFIFFFWLAHNNPAPGVELVNMLTRIYQIPVVHSILDAPSYMFVKNGGCMFFEGVENFLWYVKNAKFVVTNSYHGTLFAIQFGRPFYTFVVEIMKSRIDTLIDIIDIKERVVDGYIAPNRISEKVDFTAIYEKLKIEKEKSLNFLEEALELSIKRNI